MQPAPDEIQISIIGPGYGESIVVHVGNGEWLIVDSCINIQTGEVEPLKYLNRLGVDLKKVKHIIATHWHDDHVRGISEIIKVCTEARFYCPSAFTKEDFLAFTIAHAKADSSVLGRATKELATVIRLLKDRGQRPIYAGIDKTLARLQNGITVFSLSPTDAMMEKFLLKIASEIPREKQQRVRAGALNPNDTAVALLIQTPTDAILLGADLEEDPRGNWTYILNNSQNIHTQKSSLFKIAHHGSQNGHCLALWERTFIQHPTAVVVPYKNGDTDLPKSQDIQRIISLAKNAFSTSHKEAVAPIRRENVIEKTLKRMGVKIEAAQPKMGHVHLRRKLNENDWKVELEGNAKRLN